jgi:hypothetical protein
MSLESLKVVVDNLNKQIEEIKRASIRGLIEAALFVKSESQKRCPVVTGNLRASAFVNWSGGTYTEVGKKFSNVEGRAEDREADRARVIAESYAQILKKDVVSIDIGYSAEYAIPVHENPRTGKTGGVSPSGRVYSAGKTPSGRKSTRKVFSTVGEWKFLENPLKENTNKILEIITAEAQKRK